MTKERSLATNEPEFLEDERELLEEDSMEELEEDDLPKVTVKILSGGYDAKGALLLLLHTDPSLDIQEIEEVFYPYVRFRYLIQVGKGKRWEKLNKIIDCSVDRVSGSCYEAEGIPEFDEEVIYREDMLDIQIPLAECYDLAHDFAMKLYISKGKLMVTPEFQIIEEEEFFKRYFVVSCLDKKGLHYDILVDAVDGAMTILDSEHHLDLLEKSKNLLQGEEADQDSLPDIPEYDVEIEEVGEFEELQDPDHPYQPETEPEEETEEVEEEVFEFIDVEEFETVVDDEK